MQDKMKEYPYIRRVDSPAALKKLPKEELFPLCEELRRFLLDKVAKSGGHLASNLGVVELTVALHRVFDSPRDKIIFDVGHQSYVHKILTGRAEGFDELRAPGGLSGFPRRKESEHDAFGTGHSSTSLSAALGFAHAARLSGSGAYTVAVVGDGAFTGGMIHEALNNCDRGLRLVIVLNDNEMSISPSTGRFARHFSRIRISRRYSATKRRTRSALAHIPLVGRGLTRLISRVKRRIRRRVYRHNYFEEMGFTYLGPVDGHDEAAVEKALTEARERGNVTVVHVLTQKGKGYDMAEADPTAFHGVSPQSGKEETGLSFSLVAAETLAALAEEDGDICAVTAAMGEGTCLSRFGEKHPKRYFDVGIAEEHALTFSAGLAAAGYKPYFAVYSTFLQRAYDNLVHDVALQGLPVRILVDRAGLAIGDGATHHGILDVAFASHIPGVAIYSPVTYGSLRAVIRDSRDASVPTLIRYPKGGEDGRVASLFYPTEDYENYGVRALGDTGEAVILCYGQAVSAVLDAREKLRAEGVSLRVILFEALAPYDALATRVFPHIPENIPVFFAEEGVADGGAGMLLEPRLAALFSAQGRALSYTRIAISDGFAQGERGVPLRASLGVDGDHIAARVLARLGG